jgi:hypothetical protein
MMACFFFFFFFFAKVVKYWQRPFIGTFSKRVLGTCIHAKNNLCLNVKMITCMHQVIHACLGER